MRVRPHYPFATNHHPLITAVLSGGECEGGCYVLVEQLIKYRCLENVSATLRINRSYFTHILQLSSSYNHLYQYFHHTSYITIYVTSYCSLCTFSLIYFNAFYQTKSLQQREYVFLSYLVVLVKRRFKIVNSLFKPLVVSVVYNTVVYIISIVIILLCSYLKFFQSR